MKRYLSISTLIAVVTVLAIAGCEARFDVVLPPLEGSRIVFQVPLSTGFYNSWEFCWEGSLETAQGSTSGDDETFRTFQNIPGNQGTIQSPLSEELRPGTWRVRARLTGFTASGSEVRIDLNDCKNMNGDRPTVYAGTTTRVLVQQGLATCEWSTTTFTVTPNISEGVVQPCSPGVSRLAVPRQLG
jgi:hypothetical protein